MARLFTLKQGALLPAIELTLSSSTSYDLSVADSVEFRYRKDGGEDVETIALVTTDAANKKVSLTPTADMVDTVGTFLCHVKVTIGGKDMFFPHAGFDEFKVVESF